MNTRCIFMAVCLLGFNPPRLLSQPVISKQPTDQSVSLGANVTLKVVATGVAPITYRWGFNDVDIASATTNTLAITNVQPENGGSYAVVVTDSSGSITSRVATLTIDPTFTKITSGAIVTDTGQAWSCAWGDYDNDGFIDLIVGTTGRSFLYRNHGDGTFTRITNSLIVTESGDVGGTIWGDFDNDGNLDLFMAEFSGSRHRLFRNNGDGTFAKITTGVLVNSGGAGQGAAWGDYDNDGFLDLAVGKFQLPAELYRNNGDGTFSKTTRSEVGPLGDVTTGLSCLWVDYNNDGYLDLLFTQEYGPIRLYRNTGNAAFVLVDSQHFPTNNPLTASVGGVWGDFANRGNLDVFVVNGRSAFRQSDFLFRNNGDGTFTSLTTNQVGSLVGDASTGYGCAAADYDNDGYLDLFVANPGLGAPGPPEPNSLYHNNGDGTFTRVSLGSLTSDAANSTSCAWGDFDNDGFMDLYVANGAWGGYGAPKAGFLYRNNGNSNNWITLKLIGTASNRSAIGAKVRVKATIAGKTVWQLRQISGGGNYFCQDDMRPHFGLGDANIVETVRIEWPSGITQVLTNVALRQFLTVVEHQTFGTVTTPSFSSASLGTNAVVNLSVTGEPGLLYVLEASTNLLNWTKVGVRSNVTGLVEFTDPKATNYTSRLYRVSIP